MNHSPRDSTDDQGTLDQIILSYLRAVEDGQAPDPRQWLERYPERAAELEDFFAAEAGLHGLGLNLDGSAAAQGTHTQRIRWGAMPDRTNSTIEVSPERPRLVEDRYQIDRFYARGGMGEVWLARDAKIGRKVALKRIRKRRGPLSEQFLLEAQITGQLEHPGIVPLHDVGLDESGRPYYVMKFVRGLTLKEDIARYHAAWQSPGAVPEVDRLRLVNVFLDLCHTIGYAHSRGVIHRDLKPENVMLGEYGETLVLDWGLAKLIGVDEPPAENSHVRLSSGSTGDSEAGTVKGSPAYMAPEMADGRVDDVDSQTDIYLLGAVLYEILAGRPPHHADSVYEMIERARLSSPPPPRALRPDVPPALQAICLKAMARKKAERYANTTELAEDVQRWLAGEPVSAYPERLPARAIRWCRKHGRGLWRATAALLVISSCLLGTLAVRQTREVLQRQGALRQVQQIRQWAGQARFYAAHADALLEQAPYYDLARGLQAGQAAWDATDGWGTRLERLPLADEQPRLRRELYDLLLTMAQAQLHTSRDPRASREALDRLDRARGLAAPTRSYYRLRAEALRSLGETHEAADLLRRSLDDDLPTTALDHFLRGELLRTRAVRRGREPVDPIDWSVNRQDLAAALDEYQHATRLEPGHYWAHFQAGRCYLALGRHGEAVEALGTCIALAPDSPWGYSTRGLAQGLMRRFPAARLDLDHAIDLDPEFLPARLNRGVVAWLAGEIDAALADFGGILAAPPERCLVEAAYYRGQILAARGEQDAALRDFSRLLETRPDFRPAYHARATLCLARGELEPGIRDVETLVFLTTPVTAVQDWQTPFREGRYLRRLSAQVSWSREADRVALLELAEQKLVQALELGGKSALLLVELGAVRDLQGQWEAAARDYAQGLQLAPDDTTLRVKHAWALTLGLEQSEAALDEFRQVLAQDPTHAEAHSGLGYLQARAGQASAAQSSASQALLFGAGNRLVLHNAACIYAELAEADAERAGQHEAAALQMLRQAVELWRQHPAEGPHALELAAREPSFARLRETRAFQELFAE